MGCDCLRIDIMTLFPDTVNAVLHESIIGRAAKKGIVEINCVQIRDYTENKQCQVDDYPYGGGWGCVMMAQPLKSCLDSILSTAEGLKTRVIYMSPQGQPYTQETAKRLKNDYDHLVLVCGHYEGVDERFIEKCVDEEISLGDFVLTGGEIAAMAVADSVCRLVPGVLADEECYTGESHWDGLLEYPQYTRPESWEGLEVPEVLLNGDHSKIVAWRRKKQFERTKSRRPDLFSKFSPESKEDVRLMEELKKSENRVSITEPISCRKAAEDDLPVILAAVADARKQMRRHHVDQWQGPYPERELFISDISKGECFAVCHGDEPAGFFTLTRDRQPEYDEITDGKWHSEGEYCSIHRLVLSEKYKGTGISPWLLRFAEKFALEAGIRAVRSDTHRKNKAMQTLLRENGYRYRGNVLVTSEPGHDPARQAFEKILKDRK